MTLALNIRVDEVSSGKGELCARVLRGLPEWFGIESAVEQYIRDVERMTCFAAVGDPGVLGFIAVHQHNEATAEVHVMGVERPYHRS